MPEAMLLGRTVLYATFMPLFSQYSLFGKMFFESITLISPTTQHVCSATFS